VALQRLSALVHPFTWPDSSSEEMPSIDMDLYVIHTLIVASTIHLHLGDTMDLKLSWAAKRVVELIHHLTIDDFQSLDPVLAVCAFSFLYTCGLLTIPSILALLVCYPQGVQPGAQTDRKYNERSCKK